MAKKGSIKEWFQGQDKSRKAAGLGVGWALGGPVGLAAAAIMQRRKKKQAEKLRDQLAMQEAATRYAIPGVDKYQSQDFATPEYAGDVTPETAQTAFTDITEDPRLKEAQMTGLAGYEQLAKTGTTAADEARMRDIFKRIGQERRGASERLQQQFAQRGMGGSGLEAALQAQAGQAAADRASDLGLGVKAQGEARTERGLAGLGSLGTQVRGQEFDMAARKAQAQDLINRFNVGNRLNAMMRNVGTRQQLAGDTADIRNRQRMFDVGQQREDWKQRFASSQSGYGRAAGERAYQQGIRERRKDRRRQDAMNAMKWTGGMLT